MTQVSSLPRSTPEAQGIPSAAIHAFVDAAERDLDALHSFMLLRHGQVVAEGWWEPYRPQGPHMLFSLSKSFTSTAIGLLVAEGRLSVDDPVLAFFSGDAPPEPGAHLQAMRVRHLLTMTTGHAVDTLDPIFARPGRTWVQSFLAQPVEYAPGTHFLYNTGATYMLSAIVQQLTGGRMIDYLQPRLFAPLGIADPRWETSPQGIDVGGWGLSITTADIAAFGQLYLQKGQWRGARILPEAWVAAATSFQVDNGPADNPDWGQGYGYQFWRCRHDAYRGDGAFGQYCVVMPEQDAVLAITAGLGDMQPPLNLVWQHLLPTMGAAPLPAAETAQAALTRTLASLQLRTPQGQPRSPVAAHVPGKSYAVAANPDGIEAIRFDFGAGETQITVRIAGQNQPIFCGYDHWRRGETSLGSFDARHPLALQPAEPWKIGASGAWTDESTYTAKLWFYETPFARTLTCRFAGDDRLVVDQQANVAFGPTEGPQLQGRLA
jgi:CubicO group peptidase (beta-lactamase class C family)